MSLSLIIDNRERAVFEHFPGDDETIITAQMTIGDYAIASISADGSGCIHEIFERKTLKDYADSIRDGRHENRMKMLSLRDRTECRVYYIIEGPPLSTADEKIGGIPASTIEASIFNLMSNHNIFVLYSSSQADTARLLMAKRKALANSLKQKKLTHTCSVDAVIDMLTAVPVVTYDQIKREYFESFPKIGPKVAAVLTETVTIADAIISPETIPKTVTVSGRKIKVALPEDITDRIGGLKCMPRAGNLRELLDVAPMISTIEELEDCINKSCKPKMAAKLITLIHHIEDK